MRAHPSRRGIDNFERAKAWRDRQRAAVAQAITEPVIIEKIVEVEKIVRVPVAGTGKQTKGVVPMLASSPPSLSTPAALEATKARRGKAHQNQHH